ncbi:MAG: hypothetical protein HIU86_11305 [Acidobacteria bacterium]|nr:hypothetical protein [Acidobacteriota bacterium]
MFDLRNRPRGACEHDSRKISLQQEESRDSFLLVWILPADVLGRSC